MVHTSRSRVEISRNKVVSCPDLASATKYDGPRGFNTEQNILFLKY